MSPRSKSAGRRVVAAAVFTLAACEGLLAAPRFPPLSTWDQAALERARADAAQRLQQPECQRVLSDFTDAEGHTLLAKLESWQQTPSQYLQESITFVNGSTLPRCRKASIMMATTPGQVSVFVCPADGATPGSRFARIQMERPSLAGAMVIHEMLHTLGLEENPPTSLEITDRVIARCR
jgi:hypothetical protein